MTNRPKRTIGRPPLTFRRGWENEQLAIYLLSKISYIARPTTVSDDYGVDLFCTVFGEERIGNSSYGFPRSSFAIQIKSANTLRHIDVSQQIEYLIRMETPYFIGIVYQGEKGREPQLNIFSAELLSYLFAHKGFSKRKLQKRLILAPVAAMSMNKDSYIRQHSDLPYCFSDGKNSHILLCPRVGCLTVGQTHSDRLEVAESLVEICRRAQRNIATRLMDEHVYDLPGVGLDEPIILAGEGSFKTYRRNVERRIAEVFLNHIWIIRNKVDFPVKEFIAFRRLYQSLSRSTIKPSKFLEDTFNRLQVELEKNPSLLETRVLKSRI